MGNLYLLPSKQGWGNGSFWLLRGFIHDLAGDQDQQTRFPEIIDNACGIIYCFSKVSYSVRRTFNQPTETSFLLLDFSFRKDLVHLTFSCYLRTVQTQCCWYYPPRPAGASPYPRTKVSNAFSFPLRAGTVMWGDRNSRLYISKTSSFPKR